MKKMYTIDAMIITTSTIESHTKNSLVVIVVVIEKSTREKPAQMSEMNCPYPTDPSSVRAFARAHR